VSPPDLATARLPARPRGGALLRPTDGKTSLTPFFGADLLILLWRRQGVNVTNVPCAWEHETSSQQGN